MVIKLKRIITIQDISCVGRCSLTVALPIISAEGVECAILPTALLSTHTAFDKFTFRDLTDEIQPIADTLAELNIGFDAIYTGYLGSFEQLRLVDKFYERFGGTFFIDPVMGDYGKLYKGFTQEFADEMTKLCTKADLIMPNLTEASYMLHIPYQAEYDEAYIRDVLLKLAGVGIKRAALTGIGFKPNEIGYYMYDSVSGRFSSYFGPRMPESYHGTGDIFASAVLGAHMRGLSIDESLQTAVDFTLECIIKTQTDPNRRDYGVSFELALPMLIDRLKERSTGRE